MIKWPPSTIRFACVDNTVKGVDDKVKVIDNKVAEAIVGA
jgi:hypothetical protein